MSVAPLSCPLASALTIFAGGELEELIEEFSEGRVQFAFVKVIDPSTGLPKDVLSLPKNVLIAWCGEGVPERTKGYFTSHLASVSKFLHVSKFEASRLSLVSPLTAHFRIGVSCSDYSSGRR